MKNRSQDVELLEKLAGLEHEQWMKWSKEIAEREPIMPERLMRWEQFWIPYKDLPEDAKEHDRKWARKVLEIINQKDLALDNADRWAEMAEELLYLCASVNTCIEQVKRGEISTKCDLCMLAEKCRKNQHDNEKSAGVKEK